MKNKKNILLVFITLLLACSSIPAVSDKETSKAAIAVNNTESVSQPAETIIQIKSEVIQEPQAHSLTFIAAGDNLFHDSLINSFLTDGVYDYSPIYSEVKSIVENAGIAFINQETVMAGESFGYSGYPLFNTPQSLAYALKDTGFDIINLANNHAMDMGRDGLYATLDFLNSIDGFTVTGARKEGKSARLITKNNITLGILSYTYGLNGHSLPRENPNLVSLINRDKMTQEISELRPLCDFLIVSIHWGDEYMLEPNKTQTDLAHFLAERNVDLVIGHHPHVLQRADIINLEDGRKTFVFYSLGNFVSHQRDRERIIGAMASVTFTKLDSVPPRLSISDSGLLPVITHFDRRFANTKIYPLYSYSQELLLNHRLKNDENTLTMDFFYSVFDRLNAKIIMEYPF